MDVPRPRVWNVVGDSQGTLEIGMAGFGACDCQRYCAGIRANFALVALHKRSLVVVLRCQSTIEPSTVWSKSWHGSEAACVVRCEDRPGPRTDTTASQLNIFHLLQEFS